MFKYANKCVAKAVYACAHVEESTRVTIRRKSILLRLAVCLSSPGRHQPRLRKRQPSVFWAVTINNAYDASVGRDNNALDEMYTKFYMFRYCYEKSNQKPGYICVHTRAGAVLTTSCSLRIVSLSKNCRRTDRMKVHSRGRSSAE